MTENQNIEILKQYTFIANYNLKSCLKLINKAFEQTENCKYSDYCSLWKVNFKEKFPKMLNEQLNV